MTDATWDEIDDAFAWSAWAATTPGGWRARMCERLAERHTIPMREDGTCEHCGTDHDGGKTPCLPATMRAVLGPLPGTEDPPTPPGG